MPRPQPDTQPSVQSEPRHIRNVALIGFMGAGKSTVGTVAAHLLRFGFVDTDDWIEAKTSKKISAIFAEEGEPRFREYERQAVDAFNTAHDMVIATGGGLAAQPGNLERLRKHALVVCLWATPDRIWERVRHQTHRPLLQDPAPLEKIRTMLKEREPYYRQADVLINTDCRTPRELAQIIIKHFNAARVPPSSSNAAAPSAPRTAAPTPHPRPR